MEHSLERFGHFIVPIFKNGQFEATGFVYKSWLITAGHVIMNSNPFDLSFEFADREHCGMNYIYGEYNRYITSNNPLNHYCEDLAIFQLETNTQSPIELLEYDDSLYNCNAEYVGYLYDEADESHPVLISKKGLIKTQIPNNNYNNLLLDGIHDAVEGMSGGPVFVDDMVIGMLVTQLSKLPICKLISAKHIAEVIACLEERDVVSAQHSRIRPKTD